MRNTGYGRRAFRMKLKSLLGFGCIILAIAGIFLWESFGREELLYSEVIVMRKDVDENQIVHKEMLCSMSVPREQILSDAVIDPEQIIGKETSTYIPMGLQLSKKFFDDSEMTIGNGKYVLAVPAEWIYSYPQTIRRGDDIYFYPIVTPQREADYYNENGAEENLEKDLNKSVGISGETALLGTKVAFVKDGSNREVIDVTGGRIDGSSSVSKIEVISTDEQYQILKEKFEAGYQFVIMYE